MQAAEFAILNWIQSSCRCAFLDAAMPAISAICNHGEVWIALAVILLLFRRTRRTGAAIALALALNFLCCNLLLKPWIARIRPCDVSGIALLIPRPTDYSFPSGHTAASFAATSALRASGSRLWLPAFFLSLLISFSRLYLYVHWPSDVLAGVFLGIAIGYLGRKLLLLAERRLRAGSRKRPAR